MPPARPLQRSVIPLSTFASLCRLHSYSQKQKRKWIYFRTDMNVLGHFILHITTIWAECSSFLSAGPRLVHKSSQSESCSPEMAPHVPCQGQHSVKEKGSWAWAKGWLFFGHILGRDRDEIVFTLMIIYSLIIQSLPKWQKAKWDTHKFTEAEYLGKGVTKHATTCICLHY